MQKPFIQKHLHIVRKAYSLSGNICNYSRVLTETREKVGTSEPAAGQVEHYESVTTPDNSGPGREYQELEMSRR